MRGRTLLPGVLRHYDRTWLRGDLLGGLTVAAYGIPQVMAYAEVAGLPAFVGLTTMIAPLLVYAVIGSSRQLSVGPESTTALMTAAAVGRSWQAWLWNGVQMLQRRWQSSWASWGWRPGCCAWASWPGC